MKEYHLTSAALRKYTELEEMIEDLAEETKKFATKEDVGERFFLVNAVMKQGFAEKLDKE